MIINRRKIISRKLKKKTFIEKRIKKDKKHITFAYVIIKVSLALNNIFITVTDPKGNVLLKKSSGLIGFRNTKKRNTYVAVQMTQNLLPDLCFNFRFKTIWVKIASYRAPELYSILKQIKEFYFMKNKKLVRNFKKKKTRKSKRHRYRKKIYVKKEFNLFGVSRYLTKSHNGMRAKKARRT